jgi:hypothetical protein
MPRWWLPCLRLRVQAAEGRQEAQSKDQRFHRNAILPSFPRMRESILL